MKKKRKYKWGIKKAAFIGLIFVIPTLLVFLIFPYPWKKITLEYISIGNVPDDLIIEARIPRKAWEVFITEALSIPLNLKYFNVFVENKSFVKECEVEHQTTICVKAEGEEIKKYHQNCIWEKFEIYMGTMFCEGGFIVPFGQSCSFRYLAATPLYLSLQGGMHTCYFPEMDWDKMLENDKFDWGIYAKPYLTDWIAKAALVFLIYWGVILVVSSVCKLFRGK